MKAIIVFVFLTVVSIVANSEQVASTIGGIFKCDSYSKLDLLSTKLDKVNWTFEAVGIKEDGERQLYISSTKEDSAINLQDSIFLNDPVINGKVHAFKKQVRYNNYIKANKYFSDSFYQVVVIPPQLECDESIRLKIRDRFLGQSKVLQLYKGIAKKKSDYFKLDPKEILLFEESGYAYYFYPPNYVSKYKIDKKNKKIFQSTIYLYSMVIDSDLKLRYPSQKIMIQRFDEFFKNILNDSYEIKIDKYITDQCIKC